LTHKNEVEPLLSSTRFTDAWRLSSVYAVMNFTARLKLLTTLDAPAVRDPKARHQSIPVL